MAAGIVVSIPFWNQSLWHGPVVDALPQLGDLSFIVGFVVAAGVYYALAGKSATEAAAAAFGGVEFEWFERRTIIFPERVAASHRAPLLKNIISGLDAPRVRGRKWFGIKIAKAR